MSEAEPDHPADAINAATAAPELAGAQTVVAAAPAEAAPEAPAAAKAPPALDRIGSPKTFSVLCAKRVQPHEYVGPIFEALRVTGSIPAAASKASAFRLGDVAGVAFSFPINPGFVEYDVLLAYVIEALADVDL